MDTKSMNIMTPLQALFSLAKRSRKLNKKSISSVFGDTFKDYVFPVKSYILYLPIETGRKKFQAYFKIPSRRHCSFILNVKYKQKNLNITGYEKCISDTVKALTLAANELTSRSDL